MKKKGRIVILSGPSGSGKTTLHHKLLLSRRLKKKLVKSVSVTTRPKRSGEKHGRDYLFVSKKVFARRIKNDYFLEHKKVFANYYGTPRQAVERLLRSGKNVLLCIDVKGARSVAHRYRRALKLFVKAPSMSELKNRLLKRGSETKKDLRLRLQIARREMREAKRYDYVVVNDNIPRCAGKLEDIIIEKLNI